jgi:hypothetical protein
MLTCDINFHLADNLKEKINKKISMFETNIPITPTRDLKELIMFETKTSSDAYRR